MQNVNQYHHRISQLFQSYLTGHTTVDELITGLKVIEDQHKRATQAKGSLWFQFSKDDTLVTTIEDLQKDLSNSNRDFTQERIREGIALDNELLIYFS